MTTEFEPSVPLCGYRMCGEPLPPVRNTRGGRPRSYCPDGSRPGWRSCKDEESRARAAEDAASLDVPLETFRDAAGPLTSVLETAGKEVATLLAAVKAVDAGALTRIERVEQATEAARTRTREAEDSERAMAHKLARAQGDMQELQDEVRASKRLLRDGEEETRKRVDAAWAKVVEHEAARAKAEERATTNVANLRGLQQRFSELAAAHDKLLKEHQGLTQATSTMESERDAAVQERNAARELAEQRAGEASAAQGAKATLEGERVALRDQLADLLAVVDQRDQELTAAARATSAMEAERDAARELEKQRAHDAAMAWAAESRAIAAANTRAAEDHRRELAAAQQALEQRDRELAAARGRRRGGGAGRRATRSLHVAGASRGGRPGRSESAD